MTTIVVSLLGTNTAPNFKILPPQWLVGDTRILLVENYVSRLVSGYLVSNCDVLVEIGVLQDVSITEQIPRLWVPRVTKTRQINRINKIGSLYPNFCELATQRLKDLRGEYKYPTVIKSDFGARGLAQFKIPACTFMPSVLQALLSYAESKDLTALKRALPNIDLENRLEDEEAIKLITQNPRELLIQQFIPVVCELRLLVAKIDGEYRILRRWRDRTEGEYPQASDTLDRPVAWMEEHYETHAKTIMSFINELDPIFGSVDIFFTEDGKWGCFEYQPEFSAEAFDENEILAFHRDFITSCAVHLTKSIG